MKMLIIAAAAMAGGAVLGFALCWAATRLAGGNRKAAARLAKAAEKKMGTMDKVLILEAVVLILYTAADLVVFWHTGNEPDTLTACVFGVCGFENGVMGWIKTTKRKTGGGGRQNERERPPDRTGGTAHGPDRAAGCGHLRRLYQ